MTYITVFPNSIIDHIYYKEVWERWSGCMLGRKRT